MSTFDRATPRPGRSGLDRLPALARPAFEVSGRPLAWAAVIDHARDTGTWAIVEEEVRAGVALLRAAQEGQPGEAELREAATAFRYDRGLIAAEEMETWLARWDLTAERWMDHLRRALLLARSPAPTAALPRLDQEDAEPRIWATAVCSGTLERVAGHLAEVLAMREALREHGLSSIRLSGVREQFARDVITEDALRREIERRPLDLIRVETDAVRLSSLDAAREALLCLTKDGLSPREVAATAGGSLQSTARYLVEIEPDLRAELIGAVAGDVVGPIPDDGGFSLHVVRAKTQPSLDDKETRRRAGEAVLARAIKRQVEEHVVFDVDH
ncbi:MAG: hypothetical protein ABR600_02500 [Actinomycetota bacterium]